MEPEYIIVKRNKKTYFDSPWKVLNTSGEWTQTGKDEQTYKDYNQAVVTASKLGCASAIVNLNKNLVGED